MVFAFPLIVIIGLMLINVVKDIRVVYEEEDAAGIYDKKRLPEKEAAAEEAVAAEGSEA